MKKNRLGKGLGALIPSIESGFESAQFMELDPKSIKTNPFQPRQQFDEMALNELKQSIKENGLIQPLVVRKIEDNFELIAGERRLRSCIDLGFEKVPVYVLQVEGKEQMLEIALIENIQREKLNIIEEALAYKQLSDECSLTLEEIATKIGKDRSTINNIIRLLKLPKSIQELVKNNQLSMGHARALITVDNSKLQMDLADKIVKEELSVRKTEEMIQQKANKTPVSTKKNRTNNPFHLKIENEFRQVLATQVRIIPRNKGGVIELEYYNDEDLMRIKEIFAP